MTILLAFIWIAVPVTIIAYIVWIILSLYRKKYRTAAVLVLMGMLFAGGVAFAIWKALGAFDPCLVEPTSVKPAMPGATVGYAIKGRTLSVVSSNSIVCVAVPGFRYESVYWLLPKPGTVAAHELTEYRFQLPPYVIAAHVRGPDSEAPPKIKAVAGGGKWR